MKWIIICALVFTLAACKGEVSSGTVIGVRDSGNEVLVKDSNGNTEWLSTWGDKGRLHCKVGTRYPACNK